MSNLWKRWGVLALAAMLMLSLAACGGGVNEKDVATYIQGRMEAYYLGQANEEYMKLMEYSEEAIQEQYNMNVQAEAERMLGFMDVKTDNKNVMDGVRAEAESLVKDIYAKCKFTVGDTNKLKNGSFTTEVTVEPIELMYLITNEDIDEIFSEILEDSLGHYASCIVHAFRMIGAQEDAGALEQICDIAPPDLMRGEFLENAWEEYALSTFNEDHELTEGAIELIEHLSGRLYLHTGRDIWSLLFQYLDRELGQTAP